MGRYEWYGAPPEHYGLWEGAWRAIARIGLIAFKEASHRQLKTGALSAFARTFSVLDEDQLLRIEPRLFRPLHQLISEPLRHLR